MDKQNFGADIASMCPSRKKVQRGANRFTAHLFPGLETCRAEFKTALGSKIVGSEDCMAERYESLNPSVMSTRHHWRQRLPYGMWTFENGTQVLFNRSYHPIWKRRVGEFAGRVEPHWVKGAGEQEYFYDDADGQNEAILIRKLEHVLADFVGLPGPPGEEEDLIG